MNRTLEFDTFSSRGGNLGILALNDQLFPSELSPKTCRRGVVVQDIFVKNANIRKGGKLQKMPMRARPNEVHDKEAKVGQVFRRVTIVVTVVNVESRAAQ